MWTIEKLYYPFRFNVNYLLIILPELQILNELRCYSKFERATGRFLCTCSTHKFQFARVNFLIKKLCNYTAVCRHLRVFALLLKFAVIALVRLRECSGYVLENSASISHNRYGGDVCVFDQTFASERCYFNNYAATRFQGSLRSSRGAKATPDPCPETWRWSWPSWPPPWPCSLRASWL